MIYFHEKTDSTNLQAKKLAKDGAASGSVVWALSQNAGRGRLGKQWISVAGKGLYASFILRPDVEFAEYAKMTLVAGVALTRFLAKVLSVVKEKKPLPLALKWPNDVLVQGKKIAGILAEAGPPGDSPHLPYLILGVGLNVLHKTTDFPQEIQQQATSMLLESEKKFKLETLLLALQKELLECSHLFECGHFPELLKEWCSMDYLYGKRIECVNVNGDIVSGISLGPDEEGILYLEGSDGHKHEILSGDLRLAGKQKLPI